MRTTIINKTIYLSAISVIAILSCDAQNSNGAYGLDKFSVYNRTLSAGTEKGSVHLNEMPDDGVAWVKDASWVNGSIELDIRGKDIPQQSFVGIAFHGLNDTTYECVYFRPFNFRSPDSAKKAHCVEYVAPPLYDWPVLRTNFPGKCEQGIDPAPDPNQWIHAKITVMYEKISVFVNGNKKPSLIVESLLKKKGKKIGFWVGNHSDGDFKNLTLNDKTEK